MKIVHIFGPVNDPDEGLWALKLDGEVIDEFRKILEIWRDTENMYACCLLHLEDLQKTFDRPISAEEATMVLMEEADELLELLYKLGKKELPGTNLQHVFKPLDNRQSNLTELQLSKGSAKSRYRMTPKLRLYAVRIGENTFVVTGGAIKLTHRMEERSHTQRQLIRLTGVKDWLRSEGILYPEDLTDLS